MAENQALKTFIIYARDDKAYKDQLLRHLRPLVSSGYLRVWHDGDILPGEDWEKKIKTNLKTSQLVLVLVSVNCLNSDFIEGEELETAVGQLRDGHTRIVPIIISPCGWRFHKLFVGLQGLPEDMKPVSNWANPDQAWTDVVESLAKIVEETRAEHANAVQKKREAEEKQGLTALAAEEQAQQKRLVDADKQELANLTARQAHAEQLRREHEVEQKRPRLAAIGDSEANNRMKWAGLGLATVLVGVFLVWVVRQQPEKQDNLPAVTEPAQQQTGSGDQMAYDQALKTGTVAAWKDFLQKHPNSTKAAEAQKQVAELDKRVKKLLRTAHQFIDVEEPENARKSLDDAEKLDPENPELLNLKKSLK